MGKKIIRNLFKRNHEKAMHTNLEKLKITFKPNNRNPDKKFKLFPEQSITTKKKSNRFQNRHNTIKFVLLLV